jgi:hypothetical protein
MPGSAPLKKKLFSSRPTYETLAQWAREAKETKEDKEKVPIKAQLEAFLDKQNGKSTKH